MHDSVVPVVSSSPPSDRRLRRALALSAVLLAGSLWAGATWGRDLAVFIIGHVRMVEKAEAKAELDFETLPLARHGPGASPAPMADPIALALVGPGRATLGRIRMISFPDPSTPAIADLSRPLSPGVEHPLVTARLTAEGASPTQVGDFHGLGAPNGGRAGGPSAGPGRGASATESQPDAQPPLDLKPLDPSVLAPLAPAPEPSSWALMVLGFGLAGAGLRRVQRRRQR